MWQGGGRRLRQLEPEMTTTLRHRKSLAMLATLIRRIACLT
jgi:hypothetical protein